MKSISNSEVTPILYDAHCHCSELKGNYDVYIAAVSMDLKSSLATLSMRGVLRGVGIHPWNAGNGELREVLNLVREADFLGEIGLDYRLSRASKEVQLEYFSSILEAAPEKTANVHALDAWRDALNILLRKGVKRAILHWYSGPVELLKEIEGAGYFITINPSVTFQEKHKTVLEKAPLEILLTESDGGYVYRGRLLEPPMVRESLESIAKVKGIGLEDAEKAVERNFKRAFNI